MRRRTTRGLSMVMTWILMFSQFGTITVRAEDEETDVIEVTEEADIAETMEEDSFCEETEEIEEVEEYEDDAEDIVFQSDSEDACLADFRYSIQEKYGVTDESDSQYVMLEAYNGTEEELTFPAKAVVDGKEYEVRISNYFAENNTIKVIAFEKGFHIADESGWALRFFSHFSNLEEVSLQGVDSTNLLSLYGMFENCRNLKSVDFGEVDFSKVTDTSDLFDDCASLQKIDLSAFKNAQIYDMSSMFNGCTSLEEIDFGSIDTSKLQHTDWMFYGCTSLKEIDLSGFDMSAVDHTEYMFQEGLQTIRTPKNLDEIWEVSLCGIYADEEGNLYSSLPKGEDSKTSKLLKKFELSEGDTKWQESFDYSLAKDWDGNDVITLHGYRGTASDVTVLNEAVIGGKEYGVLVGYRALASVRIEESSLQSVTFSEGTMLDENAIGVFAKCQNLESIDFSGLDTSHTMFMDEMFYECRSLQTLDLSGFNTERVTDMREMFYQCESLTELDLSRLDTGAVTTMSNMFYGCSNLKKLDLTGVDTGNVSDMDALFGRDDNLEEIDLSGFDLSNASSSNLMYNFTPKIIHTPLHNKNHIPLNKIYTDENGKEYTELPMGEESDVSIVLTCTGYNMMEGTTISGTVQASSLEAGGEYIVGGDTRLVMDTDLEVSFLHGVTKFDKPVYDLSIEGSGNLTVATEISDVDCLTIGGEEIAVKAKWLRADTIIMDSPEGSAQAIAIVAATAIEVVNGRLQLHCEEAYYFPSTRISSAAIKVCGGEIDTRDGGRRCILSADELLLESGSITAGISSKNITVSDGRIEESDISCTEKFCITGGTHNITVSYVGDKILIEGGDINVKGNFSSKGEILINGGTVKADAIQAEKLIISEGEVSVAGGKGVTFDQGNTYPITAGLVAGKIGFSGGKTSISVPEENGRAILLNDNGADYSNAESVEKTVEFTNDQGITNGAEYVFKNEVMEGSVYVENEKLDGYYHIGYYVDKEGNPVSEMVIEEQEGSAEPTEAEPTPTEAEPTPTEAEPTPTEAEPAPTEAEPTPTEAEPTPTEVEPAPTEAEPTPTEAEPTPTEAEPTPTEAEPTPTETEPTPADTPVSIEDAVAQIEEKGVDAVVEDIKNADAESLAEAMANPEQVAALAVIEENYKETHNITEEAPKSTVEEIDASKVEMTGAALNTDSGTVGLAINEPENTEAVDRDVYGEMFLFDLTIEAKKADGTLVDYSEELDVPVTITMPIPAFMSLEGFGVIHYDKDGSGTELKVSINNEKRIVTFTVRHFSLFAFVNQAEKTEIQADSLTLNEKAIELVVGRNAVLIATVTPENATNKETIWSSSDPKVATVDANGKVTAVAAGKATITATTADGKQSAACVVTVTKKAEISQNTFSLEQAAEGVPVINNSDYTLKIERNAKGAITSATIVGADGKAAKEVDSYLANIVTEYQTDGKTPKTFYTLVFTDGKWDTKYDSGTNGAYEYKGVEYFVAGGVVNQNANGLIYTGAAGWRFLAAGHVVTNNEGLVMYNGEWFWIDAQGKCDDTYAAIVKWNGANFLVHGGRLRTDYTGFTYDPKNTSVWYHITAGQVWGDGEITDISIEGGEITRNVVGGKVQ